MSHVPWGFDEARARCTAASIQQKSAETAKRKAAHEAAAAERDYRVALALEIVRQHADDGVAWSVAADVARGNRQVADLRMRRDVAVGVRDSLEQAVWRASADRKDTARFAEWSMRVAVADGSIRGSDQRLQWTTGGVAA